MQFCNLNINYSVEFTFLFPFNIICNFSFFCAAQKKKSIDQARSAVVFLFISLTPFMCSELLRDISAEHEELRNEYDYHVW